MHDISQIHLTSWLLVGLTGMSACQELTTFSSRETRRAKQTSPASTEAGDEQPQVLFDHRIASGDVRAAKLGGREQAAPPRTDAPLVVALENVPRDLGLKEGDLALYAQFAGEGVLVLGTDQALRYYSREGVSLLARDVQVPFSVSGDKVAYVHGEPPDTPVALLDLTTGASEQLAPELLTAWSPALSEDGGEVIFAASHEGRPHLFRIDKERTLRSIPTGRRTPSSSVAPIWKGDDLFFEDEAGVVRFSLESASIEQEFEGAKLLPEDGSGAVMIDVGGERRVLSGGGR